MFFTRGCPQHVSQAKNKEEWVGCAIDRNFPGLVIGIIIIIIIAIITIWLVPFTWIRVGVGVAALATIAAMVGSHYLMVPITAETEYDRFMRDIHTRMDTGMTEQEARRSYATEEYGMNFATQRGPSPAAAPSPLTQTFSPFMSLVGKALPQAGPTWPSAPSAPSTPSTPAAQRK